MAGVDRHGANRLVDPLACSISQAVAAGLDRHIVVLVGHAALCAIAVLAAVVWMVRPGGIPLGLRPPVRFD